MVGTEDPGRPSEGGALRLSRFEFFCYQFHFYLQ